MSEITYIHNYRRPLAALPRARNPKASTQPCRQETLEFGNTQGLIRTHSGLVDSVEGFCIRRSSQYVKISQCQQVSSRGDHTYRRELCTRAGRILDTEIRKGQGGARPNQGMSSEANIKNYQHSLLAFTFTFTRRPRLLLPCHPGRVLTTGTTGKDKADVDPRRSRAPDHGPPNSGINPHSDLVKRILERRH